MEEYREPLVGAADGGYRRRKGEENLHEEYLRWKMSELRGKWR